MCYRVSRYAPRGRLVNAAGAAGLVLLYLCGKLRSSSRGTADLNVVKLRVALVYNGNII